MTFNTLQKWLAEHHDGQKVHFTTPAGFSFHNAMKHAGFEPGELKSIRPLAEDES